MQRTPTTGSCGGCSPRSASVEVKHSASADDLDAGIIHIRNNAVVVDGKVKIGTPKTERSKRRVKIGPETVALLRDHLAPGKARRSVWAAATTTRTSCSPRRRQAAQSTSARHFGSSWRNRPAAGHLLHARHGHATLLLDRGEKILHDVGPHGSDDPAILRRYAHHDTDSQDRCRFSKASSISKSPRPALRVVRRFRRGGSRLS